MPASTPHAARGSSNLLKTLPAQARGARLALGLTQAELAARAGVSLATVQNLEAGRANPALETAGRILACLAMRLEPAQVAPDWTALAAHGLPMAGQLPGKALRSPSSLRLLLEGALLASRDEANQNPRQSEALQALMLALAHGYPSLYAAWFSRSALAKAWVPVCPSGRVIKLRRIALSVLAEYL